MRQNKNRTKLGDKIEDKIKELKFVNKEKIIQRNKIILFPSIKNSEDL